jgi:hypothetical protein
MKFIPRHAGRAAAASLLMLCAACGGQAPRENERAMDAVTSGGSYVGARPVYAQLANNKDGSWAFRTVTESDASPDTAYLVRLNDLTPAFDTRVVECAPQIYPEAHRCNPANPFRDEESGVLEKIVNGSIAVGTGGKIKDITYSYKTTFDEIAFNRAVDEALLNSGLDRRRLISLLAAYDQELREARAELQAARQRMEALRSGYDQVELKIQPAISGLTDYYQDDIDFARLVELEAIDATTPELTELEATAILPCDARACVASANAALEALRLSLKSGREQIAAGTRPSSRTYRVHCGVTSHAGYLLDMKCPEELSVVDNEPVLLPVSATILSRDFDDLYPAFNIAGPDLDVHIDGQAVTFANTSSEYLTISAQTVYYNSAVHTTTLPIEIPPGISVSRELDEFVSQAIGIESRYLQMTPDKASGASFRFGFAVRYRLASQGEARTLHEMATFNVDCVIRNRMQPGSCQAESLADAGMPQESALPTGQPRPPM